MSQLHRYFTTPIFYANGDPHAGHIYATILASILKNHYASRGVSTKFLTGMDEHGEAVETKAKELGKLPQQHVDEMSVKWKQALAQFEINYDIFLRTTSTEHKKNVTEILNYCYKKGDIYYGEHEGSYCVKCESFLTSSEIDEHQNCLIHKIPTEARKEGNYFFKTSKYREKLQELIENKHISSQDRYNNELLSILKHLEGDLSISRPKTRLTWGVELPFDTSHVAYVWFDALPNYVTGIGGLNAARSSDYWKNAYHVLGKDILKFHGIFWPAMCLSLDIPVPKLLVTGWLLKDGHKMSKSLGNVLSVEDIFHYGRDMFTNFVFRSVNPGEDIDIAWKTYFERYNSDLANGLGNLLSRSLTMVEKYFSKKIPHFYKDELSAEQKDHSLFVADVSAKVTIAMDNFKIADALNEIWKIIYFADKHITEQKPWELAKDTSESGIAKLSNVLATVVASLRAVGFLCYAFFPKKMGLLLSSLGENTQNISDFYSRLEDYFNINSNFVFHEIPKLYNRIDIQEELKKINGTSAEKKVEKKNSSPSVTASTDKVTNTKTISIDDFSKVEMRVGTVILAELVEGSDKLLKLIVSLGELGHKQVFSGIREWVKPEEVANRKVIIVCNLAVRKMKFGESEGMMLSTQTVDGKISPVYLPEDLKEGSLLS